MRDLFYPVKFEYGKHTHVYNQSTCSHWRPFPRIVRIGQAGGQVDGVRLWLYMPWGTAFNWTVYVDRRERFAFPVKVWVP